MRRDTLLAAALAGLAFTLAVAGCGDDDNGTPAPTVTFARVDRVAIPTLNTVLIPANRKDAFNAGSPETDVSMGFRTVVDSSITALRNAVRDSLPPEDFPGVPSLALANIVIPDIVTVNFAAQTAFPNGRRLQDDVVDAALGLVLNRGNVLSGGPGVPDGIAANDVPFQNVFPYLADPH